MTLQSLGTSNLFYLHTYKDNFDAINERTYIFTTLHSVHTNLKGFYKFRIPLITLRCISKCLTFVKPRIPSKYRIQVPWQQGKLVEQKPGTVSDYFLISQNEMGEMLMAGLFKQQIEIGVEQIVFTVRHLCLAPRCFMSVQAMIIVT